MLAEELFLGFITNLDRAEDQLTEGVGTSNRCSHDAISSASIGNRCSCFTIRILPMIPLVLPLTWIASLPDVSTITVSTMHYCRYCVPLSRELLPMLMVYLMLPSTVVLIRHLIVVEGRNVRIECWNGIRRNNAEEQAFFPTELHFNIQRQDSGFCNQCLK
jgi:hypothetical protein